MTHRERLWAGIAPAHEGDSYAEARYLKDRASRQVSTNQPPKNMTTQIHRITPKDPPKFPCWLWYPPTKSWPREGWYYNALKGKCDEAIYWHPDQLTAPTETPEQPEREAEVRIGLEQAQAFSGDTDGLTPPMSRFDE